MHLSSFAIPALYSLHEPDVAVIKKGKSHPDCEFGAIVALTKNDDGLIQWVKIEPIIGHLKCDQPMNRCRYPV